jgi:DNA-binding NtrC family response regulator
VSNGPESRVGRVLLVDDEYNILVTLSRILKRKGFDATIEISPVKALRRVIEAEQAGPNGRFDLAVIDLRMPEMEGLDLLAALQTAAPSLPVIVLTGFGTIRSAIEAMRRGAFEYLVKPSNPDEILAVMRRALTERGVPPPPATEASGDPFARLVARSERMKRLVEQCRKLAVSDSNVLIGGESGTGKELLARAIHDASSVKTGPFVAVNCAAIPAHLAESSFFGHSRGAFTGAERDHEGWFRAAHGGTLFLDEVADLPQSIQPMLLRVLQDRQVTPVGDTKASPVQVRIVSASNKPLEDEVQAGRFRADLLYRLSVVTVELPTLRERLEELPHLVEALVGRERTLRFSDEALARLQQHDWPGNVRELRNVVERVLVLSTGPEVGVDDLPDYLSRVRQAPSAAPAGDVLTIGGLEQLERQHILRALDAFDGKKAAAARALGIDRKRLYRKMRRLGMLDGSDPVPPQD